VTIMNPVQCPDCESYNTGMMGNGIHLCQGCGMVWTPGSFYNQYHQGELDLSNYEDPIFEDIDTGSEDFTPCPLCSSKNIVGLVDISGDLAGRYLCRECGCEFTIYEGMDDEDDEEDNVHGYVTVCPHCMTADSIQIYGEIEWCGECWMDPNELDQDSPEIAKLYKGGIKDALERNVGMLKPGKSYGKFVRQECGPHCSFAKACPQDTDNLIKCFNEELEEDDELVGKRKRGKKNRKNRSQKQIMKHNQKAHKYVPSKVAFFCSKGGLLEKMILYGTTDPDTEQPGNTGSQSGA